MLLVVEIVGLLFLGCTAIVLVLLIRNERRHSKSLEVWNWILDDYKSIVMHSHPVLYWPLDDSPKMIIADVYGELGNAMDKLFRSPPCSTDWQS